MEKVFYVLEENHGNGATGFYLTDDSSEQLEHVGKKITTDIYKSIRFTDKESAERLMRVLRISLKDWRIEEHLFCDEAPEKKVIQVAQGVLTCLNIGNIHSESAIHKELRKVMINYRQEINK